MDMQQLLANAKANQDFLTKLQANRESDREELRGMINANLKYLKEDIKSTEAEMRSTFCAFRSELKETIQHEMKAVIQPIRSELNETTACNEATEAEPSPEMMQSIEEHQKIPKGDPAVMPVGGPRKRRRVRNLAAERRQKRKERTWGNSGSWRKVSL
jgi:paraquat-inducible protein B